MTVLPVLLISFGFFCLSYFAVKAGFAVSALVFLISLITVFFILRKFSKKNDVEIKMSGSPSQMTVRKTVFEGRKKVSKIRSGANVMKKSETRALILEICSLADRIFADFEKDPEDIKAAKKFLNYYLDATVNIVEKYKDLSRQNLVSPESKALLEKSDDVLITIRDAFEKQLKKLLDNDIMDLDAEISLLEKTFNMENLGK